MRLIGAMAALAAALFSASASAQTSITIRANPTPIVEAQINDRTVTLEVDTRFISGIALSREAAERLRVRRVPFVGVRVGIEGSDSTISGRIARPRVLFEGRSTRAFTGIFPTRVTDRADGVIGPGALPYDIITIVIGPENPNAREIVLPLEDGDRWYAQTQVGGETIDVGIDLINRATVFNRPAARLFDRAGAIPAAGDVSEQQLIIGLSTLMQPVTTQLTVADLSLTRVFARTNAPLLGVLEEDAVVVEGSDGDAPPPTIVLGRDTLAGCVSVSVDRRAKQMTLRC